MYSSPANTGYADNYIAIAQIRYELERYGDCQQELAELAAAEKGEGDTDTEQYIWEMILEIAKANHDTF